MEMVLKYSTGIRQDRQRPPNTLAPEQAPVGLTFFLSEPWDGVKRRRESFQLQVTLSPTHTFTRAHTHTHTQSRTHKNDIVRQHKHTFHDSCVVCVCACVCVCVCVCTYVYGRQSRSSRLRYKFLSTLVKASAPVGLRVHWRAISTCAHVHSTCGDVCTWSVVMYSVIQ